MMRTSASSVASWRPAVARREVGSWTSPRYRRLVCDSLISQAISGERAQIVVAALRVTIEATVVPHDPLPRTVTRGCLRCTGR